jgi:hypothetical protein
MAITVGRRGGSAPKDEEPARGARYARGTRERESFDEGASEARDTRGRARWRGREVEEEGPKRNAARGWASAKRTREETSTNKRFKPTEDEPQLIMFLEDEPFDSAAIHFLRELRDGQKAFTCMGKKDGCPLCAAGDQPRALTYFNIAVFDADGNADVKVWEAGPSATEAIETKANSRLVNGKLSAFYFEVMNHKKSNGFFETKIETVRESEVEETWEIEPVDDALFEELIKEAEGEGYVRVSPLSALEEAARKLNRMGD